ncbi:MAG TPA: ATP-binding protein [Deltaproteobacteria bacterium]|nr:ATP-binding protein [Deltaproteobacteria bacterium]
MSAVNDLNSLRGDSSEPASTREKILLDLLGKASDFYEYTVGILSSIFEITEFVSRGSPEDDFFSYVTGVLISESRCENASIFMVEGGSIVLKAASGKAINPTNPHVSMAVGDGVAGTCAREGRTILVRDVEDCEFFMKMDTAKVRIGSMLCVPIKEGNRTLGVMNLSHSSKAFFSVHYIRVFELLGLLVGQLLTLVHLYEVFRRKNSDLNEQLKEQSESLRSITERYKAVVDASEEMICILDAQGRVSFLNSAFQKRLTRPPLTVADIFDGQSAASVLQRISSVGRDCSLDFDLAARVGDRADIICQFFIKYIGDDQILMILRDITDKRRIEQKTMQTEKLTSLGLLTSGIAHELNNKLTPILGFADLIDAESLGPHDRKRLSVIINAASAAKGIVESLLKFSRNKPPEKNIFDLREVICRTINLYSPIIKKRGITIIHEDPLDPLNIRADMNCMEQVLVNFINNAIDAIDEQQGTIWVRSLQKDDHVQVSIEDTGPGIPEAVMSKIFDPFFTTKPKEKGTGLGLSICYGIITDHKGEISLENTVNGAMATMRLPAVRETEAVQSPESPDSIPLTAHDENRKSLIMVVEDEEDLLDLMVDSLSPYYTVMTYENGKTAYDHIDEYSWELIISDLRMPVMNGMELYAEAVKRNPGLKRRFMFITGDTYDFQVKEFLENTGVTYLRKPFRIKELRETVSRQLQCRAVTE